MVARPLRDKSSASILAIVTTLFDVFLFCLLIFTAICTIVGLEAIRLGLRFEVCAVSPSGNCDGRQGSSLDLMMHFLPDFYL